MTRPLSVLIALFFCALVEAQVTFRIVQLPSSTPPDASIYLSGNFEGWTGGQEAYRLHKDADSLYSITLSQMTGTIQFKFTRGSWASVEKGPNGEEISNRVYTFGGNGAVVDITIHNWADLSGITSTASENVSLLDNDFYMPQLDRFRKIWLYLPPGYDTSLQHYPVVYMHDGQNLFDDSTSFAGEWGVDETLNEMFDETGFGMIVVGIENGGSLRIDEYSPWINPQYGGGEGEAYLEFVAETLKPHIDSTYRTLPDPDKTGLMGSSMGGLISHYGGIAEPDVFGRIGVFSPSFGLFDSCYDYTNAQGVSQDSKFYVLAGGLEGNVASWALEMQNTMLAAGGQEEDIRLVVDPQGMHNEFFWRTEFRDAIEWLFDVTSNTMDATYETVAIGVFPNPASEEIHLNPVDLSAHFTLYIISPEGVTHRALKFTGSTILSIRDLPKGVYFLSIISGNGIFVKKIMIE